MNIVSRQSLSPVSHPGVIDYFPLVSARSCERESHGPGDRGFRPTCVYRSVQTGVAPRASPGPARARSRREKRRGDEQERRQSCGQPVDRIVDACRGFAEILVARIAVPKHAVESIDGFVHENPRQTKQNKPERWRYDAIGKIFRSGFDRRARDPSLVEHLAVSPDKVGNSTACVLDTGIQGTRHCYHAVVKSPERYQCAGEQSFENPTVTVARKPIFQNYSNRDCHRNQKNRQAKATKETPESIGAAIESSIELFNAITNKRDRVRNTFVQPRGIAADRVDDESDENNKWRIIGGDHTQSMSSLKDEVNGRDNLVLLLRVQ